MKVMIIITILYILENNLLISKIKVIFIQLLLFESIYFVIIKKYGF